MPKLAMAALPVGWRLMQIVMSERLCRLHNPMALAPTSRLLRAGHPRVLVHPLLAVAGSAPSTWWRLQLQRHRVQPARSREVHGGCFPRARQVLAHKRRMLLMERRRLWPTGIEQRRPAVDRQLRPKRWGRNLVQLDLAVRVDCHHPQLAESQRRLPAAAPPAKRMFFEIQVVRYRLRRRAQCPALRLPRQSSRRRRMLGRCPPRLVLRLRIWLPEKRVESCHPPWQRHRTRPSSSSSNSSSSCSSCLDVRWSLLQALLLARMAIGSCRIWQSL
mmetsp:Transcript_48411/g.156093  ORF Transcript_48411/g.156093 Transcript_48411/m.156093 type:complete len:274 (-) Transcript_48411:943-1764(-)